MEQLTITFERIIELNRIPYTGVASPKRTVFGFQSGAKREYAVTVPGWPKIEPGMTVTCLLKKSGNWRTLLGWKNIATGEVAAADPSQYLLSTFFGIFAVFLSFFMTGLNVGQWLGQPMPTKLLSIAFLAIALIGVHQWRKQKKLLALMQTLTPQFTEPTQNSAQV